MSTRRQQNIAASAYKIILISVSRKFGRLASRVASERFYPDHCIVPTQSFQVYKLACWLGSITYRFVLELAV